jgi:hypothetical protein
MPLAGRQARRPPNVHDLSVVQCLRIDWRCKRGRFCLLARTTARWGKPPGRRPSRICPSQAWSAPRTPARTCPLSARCRLVRRPVLTANKRLVPCPARHTAVNGALPVLRSCVSTLHTLHTARACAQIDSIRVCIIKVALTLSTADLIALKLLLHYLSGQFIRWNAR